MKKGILVTFEGGEGSGKSTQHKLFVENLRRGGSDVVEPREPGGTEVGEKIRLILLDPANKTMGDIAELLLYEAARAQIVHEVVRPALEAGKTVVMDRFFDSTTAYQGYAREIDLERINWLNDYATQGIVPDITFVFDIDPEEGIKRATKETTDRLEAEDMSFHHRVRQGFLDIAGKNPGRVFLLYGTLPIEELEKQVVFHYTRFLEGR